MIGLSVASIVVLATLLGGCMAATEPATRRDPWQQPVVEPVQDDVARALRFYEHVLKLKGVELARELASASQEFDKDGTELERVRLAMLLSLPGTGFRDDQAALNLILPFLNDPRHQNSVLRPLALMLHTQLAELRQLDEAVHQQTARTREEQRRADALQQKLGAILEMEMQMIEREQTAPPPKRR